MRMNSFKRPGSGCHRGSAWLVVCLLVSVALSAAVAGDASPRAFPVAYPTSASYPSLAKLDQKTRTMLLSRLRVPPSLHATCDPMDLLRYAMMAQRVFTVDELVALSVGFSATRSAQGTQGTQKTATDYFATLSAAAQDRLTERLSLALSDANADVSGLFNWIPLDNAKPSRLGNDWKETSQARPTPVIPVELRRRMRERLGKIRAPDRAKMLAALPAQEAEYLGIYPPVMQFDMIDRVILLEEFHAELLKLSDLERQRRTGAAESATRGALSPPSPRIPGRVPAPITASRDADPAAQPIDPALIPLIPLIEQLCAPRWANDPASLASSASGAVAVHDYLKRNPNTPYYADLCSILSSHYVFQNIPWQWTSNYAAMRDDFKQELSKRINQGWIPSYEERVGGRHPTLNLAYYHFLDSLSASSSNLIRHRRELLDNFNPIVKRNKDKVESDGYVFDPNISPILSDADRTRMLKQLLLDREQRMKSVALAHVNYLAESHQWEQLKLLAAQYEGKPLGELAVEALAQYTLHQLP